MNIICDFDGTITTEDIGDLIFERFCDDQAKQYALEFYKGTAFALTIDKTAYASMKEASEAEIIRYVKEKAVIREGFYDFLKFIKENSFTFTVLSGGYDFYMKAVLGDLFESLNIISNKIDFKNGKRVINHCVNPDCQKCGNCKKMYCDNLGEEYFYIGDSLSDICAIDGAKLIFARHRLKEYLKSKHASFYEFETFYDITEILKTLL